MKINRLKAIAALFVIGVLGGVAPLFMKTALIEFSSYQILFLRFSIATVCVIPLLIRQLKTMSLKSMLLLLPAGALFSGNVFFMVVGIQYTTSIVSQLLYLLTPVFVSLLGYILYREKVSLRRTISMVVSFGGSAILITRSLYGTDLIRSIGTIHGNVLILCAVTSWSLYVIYTKRIGTKIAPDQFLTVNFVTACIVAFISLLITGTSFSGTLMQFIRSSPPVMLSLLALGFVNSVLFFFLLQWSLKQVSAFIVASTAYLSPLSAALFAIPFFGERLSITLIFAAACIGLGSYLIVSEKFRPAKKKT